MNRLLSKLPLLAFVLAAFAAFAFNFPDREVTSEYGGVGTVVYDVTNVDMGPADDEYQCSGDSGQCLFQNPGLSVPVENSEGQFEPGDALIPIPNR